MSCCETGGYSIFTPTKAVTEINGAVVSDIKETTCIKGFYADLEKDFVINIDGEIVAFDNNLSSGELRIVVPDSPYAAEYIENGVRYSIVSGKEIIHIISSDFEKEKKYKLYINTDFINFESLPYEENTGVRIYKIEIAVPTIRVIDNANVEWNGTNTYWIKDIPQERFVDVKAPAGINVEMTLNGNSIDTESSNKFALGNAVYGFSNFGNERWLKIELNVSAPGEAAQTYTLGRIAVNEQFIEAPVLKLEGEKLSWNGGYGFIGDKNSGFQITICEGTEFERTFNLQLENELIAENVELPLGEYKYSISKQSGNLFAMQSTKLVSESMFVGDVNELRFLKNIIQIDTITFEDDTKYEAVDIRTCYIDQIKYKGIHYVGSENRDCPIYTGILYFVSNSGKRHEYSYENTIDDRGHHIYQINPVRIVFINDNTLSLTNETGNMDEVGDGFYYYYYFDKDKMEKIYQLTDWEPTKFNRNKYYLADLYSYIRKEI